MAMISCPQCNEEMSNYALSCPHCGKMNPAAPQAILLQGTPKSLASTPPNITIPQVSVEPVKAAAPESPSVKVESGPNSWFADIYKEWNGLALFTQHMIQALFGCGVLVVIGLWLYVFLS